jgi:hypothetical protein
MIHKSHTKKDLIEIIDVFDFKDVIEGYKDLNKDALVQLLDIHLRTIFDLEPNKDYFDFNDIRDLREYLRRPSPKQVLTIKERDIIIDKAKKIIFYCKIAGYCLGPTTYESVEEIESDANDIKKYGDIPTCRRALKLLKKSLSVKCPDPIMTYRTQQRLDRKERIKEGGMARMSIHKGNFLVEFK